MQIEHHKKERLQQEKGGMSLPDSGHLSELKAQVEEKRVQLDSANAMLEEVRRRQPQLEQGRRDAQERATKENAAHAQLESRLSTLKQLQDNLQTEGKVAPWLEKHELGSLPRLWQKLAIETGWETALESVLRERLHSLEIEDLERLQGMIADPPPSRVVFHLPGGEAQEQQPGARLPLSRMLQATDARLVPILDSWLAGYYAIEGDPTMDDRLGLSATATLVNRQGHQFSRYGVVFHAPDSADSGLLARKREIEQLMRTSRGGGASSPLMRRAALGWRR